MASAGVADVDDLACHRLPDEGFPSQHNSVTNVLDPKQISREEWVRLAVADKAGQVLEPAGLYHRRWEIETTYAELKVTQGLEGQLRSRTPEGIRFEVAGHVLLYSLVRWLIVVAAEKRGIKDPLRLSYGAALRELGEMRETMLHSSSKRVQTVLLPRLLERVAKHWVPLRPGRHYARPQATKPKNKGKGRYQKSSTLGVIGDQSETPKEAKASVLKPANQEQQVHMPQELNAVA